MKIREYPHVVAAEIETFQNVQPLYTSLANRIREFHIILIHDESMNENEYRIFKNRTTHEVFTNIGITPRPLKYDGGPDTQFGHVTMTEGQIIALSLSLT